VPPFSITRRLTEVGLIDHLLLLSLCQTCRYKEVSFLKFLLSREQDLDDFCKGQRRKRRSSVIEVYPKRILRPDFLRPHQTFTEQKSLNKQEKGQRRAEVLCHVNNDNKE
jgi:hypothetical protein